MIFLGGLSAGLTVFIMVAIATGNGDNLSLRLPGRPRAAKLSRTVWLRQAGAPVSPVGFWLVSAAVAMVVELAFLSMVGSVVVGLVPALTAGVGPRLFWGRERTKRLAEVVEAWPDGIRNLLSLIVPQGSMHGAIVELARTGPVPLRGALAHYAELTRMSSSTAALETIREELSDPTSDGVIEMLIVGIDQGTEVTLRILADYATQITEDLKTRMEIAAEQREPRTVARLAFAMPYAALALLCATVPSYKEFYSTRPGAVTSLLAGACSLLGLVIVRKLAQERAEPRVLGGTWSLAATAAALPAPAFGVLAFAVDPRVIPGGVCAGVAAGALVYALWRPWGRLGPRTRPYTVGIASRSGSPRAQMLALVAPPATAAGTVRSVLGPMVDVVSRRFLALFGYRSDDDLRLALDRAGVRISPSAYRHQQLGYTVIGAVVGFAFGLASGGMAAVLFAAGGGFIGATRKHSEMERLTTRRAERMRLELLMVSRVMAVYSRTDDNLQAVVRRVVRRTQGEVAGELARVLDMIRKGTPPQVAFTIAAETTPEPAAARLYQTLALAVTAGGDITKALLAQAGDLRDRWRDERKAVANKRTIGMVASNASLLVLPMLILVGSAVFFDVLGSV